MKRTLLTVLFVFIFSNIALAIPINTIGGSVTWEFDIDTYINDDNFQPAQENPTPPLIIYDLEYETSSEVNIYIDGGNNHNQTIPEPATMLLLGLGLLCIGTTVKRRKLI